MANCTTWPHQVLDPNQSAKAKAGSQPIRSVELKRTVRVGHSLLHYSLSSVQFRKLFWRFGFSLSKNLFSLLAKRRHRVSEATPNVCVVWLVSCAEWWPCVYSELAPERTHLNRTTWLHSKCLDAFATASHTLSHSCCRWYHLNTGFGNVVANLTILKLHAQSVAEKFSSWYSEHLTVPFRQITITLCQFFVIFLSFF